MVRRFPRPVRGAAIAVVGLLAFGCLTLALPVSSWRTGQEALEELVLMPYGAARVDTSRTWIDTDAACGAGRTTDPDDCWALLLLLNSPGINVAGISTVFGNASLDVVDRITRELLSQIEGGGVEVPPAYRGAAHPDEASPGLTSAQVALQSFLTEGASTVLALGPLTNVAAALRNRPDLQRNVRRVVAVMGQRPGHVFHPVEGGDAGILLGHGPVFRDLNFALDNQAAAELVGWGVPLTLIPYEAARSITITPADLNRLQSGGVAAAWVTSRSRKWLSFWREDIRQEGFFPFDLLAAAYLIKPELLRCGDVRVSIAEHTWFWRWLLGTEGLFVTQSKSAGMNGHALYCPVVHPFTQDWLIDQF